MDTDNFCQSCSMPLDVPELLGTEKDGSPSKEYCKFCYQKGEFTVPGITLDEMKERMVRLSHNEKIPQEALEAAINRLPHLKRWNTEHQRMAKTS